MSYVLFPGLLSSDINQIHARSTENHQCIKCKKMPSWLLHIIINNNTNNSNKTGLVTNTLILALGGVEADGVL